MRGRPLRTAAAPCRSSFSRYCWPWVRAGWVWRFSPFEPGLLRAGYGRWHAGVISSLWMRGLVASLGFEDAVLPYRLDYARGALIVMLVMTAISQVNMLLRKTTNRNYWTRVVIIGDFCLLAAGLSGLAAVWQPDFAGLISNDISEVLLAVTCACVSGRHFCTRPAPRIDEVPEQTGSDG